MCFLDKYALSFVVYSSQGIVTSHGQMPQGRGGKECPMYN